MFWYYLQEVEYAPEILEEYSYPLTFMNRNEMRKCAFRVIVYKNRIVVEFFHSLTDGTGALVLLIEYLMTITFPIVFIGWSLYPLCVLVLLGGFMFFLAINKSAREVMERKRFF